MREGRRRDEEGGGEKGEKGGKEGERESEGRRGKGEDKIGRHVSLELWWSCSF